MNKKEVTFTVKYEIVLYTPVFDVRCSCPPTHGRKLETFPPKRRFSPQKTQIFNLLKRSPLNIKVGARLLQGALFLWEYGPGGCMVAWWVHAPGCTCSKIFSAHSLPPNFIH